MSGSSDTMSEVLSCKQIFITVGTTEFDEFIRIIDEDSKFIDALVKIHCDVLVIQIGRGEYEPNLLQERCTVNNINLTVFRFHPTLSTEMIAADLVISHCGAGSILEAMSLQKNLIVVVNSTLQGNHQSELALAMSSANYCLSTTPSEFIELVSNLVERGSLRQLKPFPPPDESIFPRIINSLF